MLREKLLLEQIQHDVGEGMWLAMSEGEQKERLIHVKLRERRLSSSDEGSLTNSHKAGSPSVEYQRNLLALLGSGRINHEDVLSEENKRREMLENEGSKIGLCCRWGEGDAETFFSALVNQLFLWSVLT